MQVNSFCLNQFISDGELVSSGRTVNPLFAVTCCYQQPFPISCSVAHCILVALRRFVLLSGRDGKRMETLVIGDNNISHRGVDGDLWSVCCFIAECRDVSCEAFVEHQD